MQTSVKSYYWAEFNPDFRNGVVHPTEYFKSETEYDSTGEFATGVSDQRAESIKLQNSYNTTKGLLNSTADPNGQVTNYTYDADSDLITGVSTIVGDTEYSVLYAIDNSGAHKGVVISFQTFEMFVPDVGITDPKVKKYSPVVSVRPGPISVMNVKIVG